MIKLPSVSSGLAFTIDNPWLGRRLFLSASGTTPTSGWSGINLSQYFYLVPPGDGVWEFDLIGDQPSGIVLDVQTPFVTSGVFPPPGEIETVRIHAETNSIEVAVVHGVKSKFASASPGLAGKKGNVQYKTGNMIYQQDLASFDDSIQPIGFCSFPAHPKMKKLHHTLTLTVEGPDQGKIQQCLQQAAAAGLIAAIIAAYATGGLALGAAVSAFVSALEGCLTNAYNVRVDDRSHWEEWCV